MSLQRGQEVQPWIWTSLCLKEQGKIRYSTLIICQENVITVLPSQILSSRCRLTLCLSTSAILDGIFQLSDSKSTAVPQELRKTHRHRHAYRHCGSCRERRGFVRFGDFPSLEVLKAKMNGAQTLAEWKEEGNGRRSVLDFQHVGLIPLGAFVAPLSQVISK